MNYKRDQKDPMKDHVEEAIALYMADLNDVGAGYRLLGYAERGLLQIDPSVSATHFFEWFPRNPAFILLRLVRQGFVSYKPQID